LIWLIFMKLILIYWQMVGQISTIDHLHATYVCFHLKRKKINIPTRIYYKHGTSLSGYDASHIPHTSAMF
jgi:hypothetical protein